MDIQSKNGFGYTISTALGVVLGAGAVWLGGHINNENLITIPLKVEPAIIHIPPANVKIEPEINIPSPEIKVEPKINVQSATPNIQVNVPEIKDKEIQKVHVENWPGEEGELIPPPKNGDKK